MNGLYYSMFYRLCQNCILFSDFSSVCNSAAALSPPLYVSTHPPLAKKHPFLPPPPLPPAATELERGKKKGGRRKGKTTKAERERDVPSL